MEADVSYYRRLVEGVLEGRKTILAGVPIAGATGWVRAIRDLGGDRCFIVAPTVGTGTLPDAADADWVDLGITADDPVAEFRAFEAAVAHLPPGVLEALDHFDPDHTALTLVAPFHAVTVVAGRPAYGARRPEWVALEDKTTIDQLWDELGVPRPPSTIVAAHGSELQAAAARLDCGMGTVWAGDAREGFNGGAVFVRWVRTPADAEEALGFLGARCDRVRVAPFVEGIPCSIHGLVLEDSVVTFRPIEMTTLRSMTGNRLRYAGCATFWDPAPADRVAMRAFASRVGAALRERVGYRGVFTIDGIMSEDGFVATEMNPRFGAGLSTIAQSVPELPLQLIHHAVAAGESLDLRPAELEALVLAAADARRTGGGWLTIDQPRTETERHGLVGDADGYRLAPDPDDADGRLTIGPSFSGGFVRFEPNRDRVTPGPSIAGHIVAAFAAADRHLGTTIGDLAPAVEVRRATG